MNIVASVHIHGSDSASVTRLDAGRVVLSLRGRGTGVDVFLAPAQLAQLARQISHPDERGEVAKFTFEGR